MLLQPGPTGSVSPSGLCLEAIIFLASVSGKTWSTKYWFEFWNTSFDWCIMNSRLVVIHQPFKLAVTVLAISLWVISVPLAPALEPAAAPSGAGLPALWWEAATTEPLHKELRLRASDKKTEKDEITVELYQTPEGLQGKVVVSQCSSDYSTRWLCSHSTIGFVYTFNLAPCLCEADASLMGIPWAAGAIGPLGSLWGHHNWSIIT